jgi:hypothetical protein
MGQGAPEELMSIFTDRLSIRSDIPQTAATSGEEIARLFPTVAAMWAGLRVAESAAYPDGRALRV